jgi:hypothetical protein
VRQSFSVSDPPAGPPWPEKGRNEGGTPCDSAHVRAEDGRILLSNNAADRKLRGIALGRKFTGSDCRRTAVTPTLIQMPIAAQRWLKLDFGPSLGRRGGAWASNWPTWYRSLDLFEVVRKNVL